jgi:hypothetical protein
MGLEQPRGISGYYLRLRYVWQIFPPCFFREREPGTPPDKRESLPGGKIERGHSSGGTWEE